MDLDVPCSELWRASRRFTRAQHNLATFRPAQEVSRAPKNQYARSVELRSLLETQPSNIVHFSFIRVTARAATGPMWSRAVVPKMRCRAPSGNMENKVLLLDFLEVLRVCETFCSDVRFYWCVWESESVVKKGLGTAGLAWDGAADRAELHGLLKPQSEQPRVQNRTWKQKTDSNTNKGNNRKIHFSIFFWFQGERGSPSFGRGSIQNKQIVHCNKLSEECDVNRVKGYRAVLSVSMLASYSCQTVLQATATMIQTAKGTNTQNGLSFYWRIQRFCTCC